MCTLFVCMGILFGGKTRPEKSQELKAGNETVQGILEAASCLQRRS